MIRCDRLVMMALVLLVPGPALAAPWAEMGDAGDLPGTAQTTAGSGPMTSIQGTLVNNLDRDVYCIRVVDHVTFAASLNCTVIAENDLWLFAPNGFGVTADDGCRTGLVLLGAPFVPGAGVYYLAISPSGDEATAAGAPIWNPPSQSGQRSPDGAGAPGPIDGWSGGGAVSSGTYTIQLQSCTFCDAPVPVNADTWGRIKQLYHYR
jgi:hypothetical protein